jgi:tRNA threonylcarbamoyladenosine biosynthesis protein TsaE
MQKLIANTPDEMFSIGEKLAADLRGGEVILLRGGLGAGKTLLTKGIMAGFGFDEDEVTSPSFALVNLYHAPRFDVYHIDLWRLDGPIDPAEAVGLDEILEDETAVVIIEWSERLRDGRRFGKEISITIEGDGADPRTLTLGGQSNYLLSTD